MAKQESTSNQLRVILIKFRDSRDPFSEKRPLRIDPFSAPELVRVAPLQNEIAPKSF